MISGALTIEFLSAAVPVNKIICGHYKQKNVSKRGKKRDNYIPRHKEESL